MRTTTGSKKKGEPLKREKVSAHLERQFLTAMITSKPFLAGVAPHLDTSLLPTRWAQQIAGWCCTHFQNYADAPGRNIEAVYHSWVDQQKPDAEDEEAVADFLESLSGEYDRSDELNVPHLIDEMSAYLTNRGITRLADTVTASLSQGRQKDAIAAITDFRSVSMGDALGFDPINDRAVLARAFADPPQPIITFPGAAEKFFNPVLTRDALVGVQGPEKRGKTFWCLEFAFRALRSRRKIAFFEVGDLTEGQIVRRMAVRMARMPYEAPRGPVKVPDKIELEEDAEGETHAKVDTHDESFPRTVDEREAKRAQKKFRRRFKLPDDVPYFMVSVHPMSSINVRGIHGILQRWRHELDFVPDVIVIDYADILAPEDGRKESRDQVNDTWKALRKLSQEWHACVIAPTQAKATSYEAKTQSMKHFAEDKRKYAHVTAMLGLNQTDEEKEMGVMRLNWIVLRESPFQSKQCLWVAQCLPLGMAYVKSVR